MFFVINKYADFNNTGNSREFPGILGFPGITKYQEFANSNWEKSILLFISGDGIGTVRMQ